MSKWKPIETAPDDVAHVRGLWVYSAETKEPMYWQADCGCVSIDGDFIGSNGDNFGWQAGDYTHWTPLPEPPSNT